MHSIIMFCTYEICEIVEEMRLQVDLTPFLWASLLHLLGQFLWHMTHVWPLGGQIPLCTITYKIRTYIHSFLVLGVKWIFRTLILYFDGMQTIFNIQLCILFKTTVYIRKHAETVLLFPYGLQLHRFSD